MMHLSPKSTTRHVPRKYHKINMPLSPESTTKRIFNYIKLAAVYLKQINDDLLFETDKIVAPII